MADISRLIKVPSVFSIRNYLLQTLKLDNKPARLSQMMLSGLATSVPLLVGLYQGHPASAILGALTGYFLTLNDHFGIIGHRLLVITLTFLTVQSGLFLGLSFHGHPWHFMVALAVLAYWMGLMGGEGAELERAFLFAAVEMIATYHSVSLSTSTSPFVLLYSLLAYVLVMGAAVVHSLLSKRPPNGFAFLSTSLRLPLASKAERHLHAFSYMVITMLSVWLVKYFEVDRGYWAVIAAMLVLKPDRRQSLNRGLQRLFGTALGVIITEPIIIWLRDPLPIILIIAFGSALVPWASKKNYWLMSMVTSVVVMLLLDLAVVEQGDIHTPLVRLKTTALGCLLGAMGVLFSKVLGSLLRAKLKQRATT